MQLTVLLAGFGPFPGAPVNPTGALVQQLARLRHPALADVQLVPHVFDTSYRAVDRDLPQLLARVQPSVVLMFGLAGGVSSLRVETRARNSISPLVRDAEGLQAPTNCIVSGGPGTLPFRIPALRFALAARAAGARAIVSHDAGRYLCNYLSWRALEAAAQPQGPKLVAFIHVPQVRLARPRRASTRMSWRMPDLVRSGRAILLSSIAVARGRRHMTEL